MKNIALMLSVATCISLVSCTQSGVQTSPLKVIFDTDMGNDIDDAIALDMLYKYMDEGKVELLGITSNKEEPQSVEYIDIMNNFYGYPDIPLGKITDGPTCDRINSFTSQISADRSYARSISDYFSLPESVDLMRKLLSVQEDGETVIIAVGFSTNLARLMASGPDAVSPLTGMELIRKKVRHLYMMAGDFIPEDDKWAEYNVRIDHESACRVFADWPGEITLSPSEIGESMLYPVSSVLNDFQYVDKHPMVEGYKVYKPMPYDRPMWDPSVVLCAVEPEWFTLSASGKVFVDDASYTTHKVDSEGLHRYIIYNEEQSVKAVEQIVEIVTSLPERYK